MRIKGESSQIEGGCFVIREVSLVQFNCNGATAQVTPKVSGKNRTLNLVKILFISPVSGCIILSLISVIEGVS